MFKRKARILFYSQSQPHWAHAAVRAMEEINSPDCEARGCDTESALTKLAPWADTVIFINDKAIATAATSKIWSVSTRAQLQTRVEGIIGGLKMLRRMDGVNDD